MDSKTRDRIMAFIEEQDVRFVKLAFCDIFGQLKNISISAKSLPKAMERGVGLNAASIRGFLNIDDSDLLLFPDPDTLTILPWRPADGKVARFFCEIRQSDGSPFDGDVRSMLKTYEKSLIKSKISLQARTEIEFYLFKKDADGNPTDIPMDRASYFEAAPIDKGENIRREICNMLEDMDIRPECSHHEEGPGQNEIDFRYSEPMKAADNATTFKSVVRTVTARNGLCADFSPKPLENAPGSGLHINFSINDRNDEALLHCAIAGIMEHAAEMTLFFNPTEDSYKRLGTNKAPAYISWSAENRSQLIRIPATPQGHCRAELRSPDPGANPYIAFALMIRAAAGGVRTGLQIPQSSEINLFEAADHERSALKKLPSSLAEAKAAAGASAFIKEFVPEAILKAYLEK